jgi:hypothetical protein
MNSVWATEKAAPVSRSGFGIIPANLFYCTTARKIVSILRADPLFILKHYQPQVLVETIIEK